LVGEAAEFRFFSSTERPSDELGSVVPDAARDLEESARLSITLSSESIDELELRQVVPVQLQSFVSELGMLELWMKHTKSNQRWKLELNVRSER